MRTVLWYMIVRADAGGAKSNEKEGEPDAKKKTRVLSAMDTPVRVRMFSERALSAGNSAMVGALDMT